ncbi:exonuclease SbcC [Actimicrobium sp. GrIS 1.19]|uniref:DUF349 domain-containing protein n=1 Tax=Actimicrobium sp. GrIS 1.19 TaxID=3071708 RepID=UPI002E05AE12|nr:exonuclease SbcC [Actimicrobium sp. GrIS 1.19]
MFDFLFKRKTPPAAAAPIPAAPAQPASTAARDAALAQAGTLHGDEAGSVAFLLGCEFAEARLKAAQGIVSKAALQQVLGAMRNTDRRVAKLMQSRLDALAAHDKLVDGASAAITQARQLLDETLLTPNQVTELDQRWQLLKAAPPALLHEFDQVRSSLAERLTQQAMLQRAVIDALAQLRALHDNAFHQEPSEVRAQLAALEADLASYRVSPEVSALPKQLLGQCADAAAELQQSLAGIEQQHAARSVCIALLDEWDAAAPESLQESTLRRSWQRLQPQSVDQERFDQLLQRVSAARPAPSASPLLPVSDQKPALLAALEAMEQALEDGALQLAAQADQRVRALDLAALHPTPAQSAQLSRLRAELGRLQGWARWGGNVSREELQKAAEALATQQLAVAELAKKIGSLRERWKSLDVSAGPAPRELWQGFDAACTAAYAPVAEHFAALAEQRQKNTVAASELIAAMTVQADALAGDDSPDWKAVALFCQRSLQAWQRLGPIDRKEKKRLDEEFDRVLQRLRTPLAAIRATEIHGREQMIDAVNHLASNERSSLDSLRALQERWQERAKALPLERNDEQALWERFRAACDAVFARRKQAAAGADAERRQNLAAREAVCAALELAAAEPTANHAEQLRDSAAQWSRIGPAPRAVEGALETRYRQAVVQLTQQRDAIRLDRAAAETRSLQEKLRLCQELEAAIGGRAEVDRDNMMARWQALPALATPLERALQLRFDKALQALRDGDAHFAELLEANRAVLARELLRVEIVLSLDSPAEFIRERLQLQVEVLQAALKSGQQSMTEQARLLALCALPAAMDAQSVVRFERAVAALGKLPT